MTPPPATIRVLAVDDHPLLREGIAALIGSHADFQLVGEATDGQEAITLFRRLLPDVTLMDLQMPNMSGIDATIAIRSEFPQARIIVLTTYAGDSLAQRALKAGAQAYVLKGSARKELLQTIRTVHAGHQHVSAEVAARLAQHAVGPALSEREIKVLSLVAAGNANKAIGRALLISEETVKSHVKSILAKLDARDRTHAVSLGIERGIIGWGGIDNPKS